MPLPPDGFRKTLDPIVVQSDVASLAAQSDAHSLFRAPRFANFIGRDCHRFGLALHVHGDPVGRSAVDDAIGLQAIAMRGEAFALVPDETARLLSTPLPTVISFSANQIFPCRGGRSKRRNVLRRG